MNTNTLYYARTVALAGHILTAWCMPKLKCYLQLNPSSDLPYHNKFHTSSMVINCYEGAVDHNAQDILPILLPAAVFHDYAHSGGKLPDLENINRAIAAYNAYTAFVTSSHSFKRPSAEL